MIVQFIEIPELAFEKVHYYTVLLEGRPHSEFRDFQIRMTLQKKDRTDLAEINRYIQQIGDEYGAHTQHFKKEDAAERLPPPYHVFIETEEPNDYGLRLYCIRLSPSVVILLNGDRKTALKVHDCNNCYVHFDRARKISREIDRAITDGFIEIDDDEKELILDEDFDITI
ncbi:MAG: hypothetical protein K2Q24_14960 [Chitinophagaceae bacterium]|nr:hypothetical protein [Chitinophagaceae bacterium]